MPECRTLAEELPFAYVLYNEASKNHCSFCLRKHLPENLKTCTKCLFARYCNRLCQKNAWIDHRQECAFLDKITPLVPGETARLLARIIHKLENDTASQSKSGWSKRSFRDLIVHKEEIKTDPYRMSQFTALQFELSELTGGVYLDHEKVFEIFDAIEINSIDIGTFHSPKIALAIYLSLSSLDHSCDPDAWIVFDGPKAILRTNQANVVLNRNVKVSYIHPLAFSADRQAFLLSHFHFSCKCKRCLDPIWDLLLRSVRCAKCRQEAIMEQNSSFTALCQDLNCQHRFDATTAYLIMKQFDDRNIQVNMLSGTCDSTENDDWFMSKLSEIEAHLSDINMYSFFTREKVRSICYHNGDWSRALELARKGLKMCTRFAENGEVIIADQWMLTWEMTQAQPLPELIDMTMKTLIVHTRSHGTDHSLVKQLEKRLEQLQLVNSCNTQPSLTSVITMQQ